MKLTIFQSDKGDCLLLSAAAQGAETHVLVDGGMAASFSAHAARRLAKLPQLDLVYLSHIDEDHISGILRLFDDAFDWRVFNFRTAQGKSHPKPKSPEPPPLRRLWHNAFHDQVKANAGAVEDIAIATASLAAAVPELAEVAVEYQNLATSVPQAIQLTQRISSKQLKVKLNEGQGKLLMARDGQKPIRIGPLTFTIIGPFPGELRDLRSEWNIWLRDNKKRVDTMRARAAADAGRIGIATVSDVEAQLGQRAADLGNRKNVTVPNLASLMVLVEEDGRSLLLTGDGHWQTILDGLERSGKMPPGANLHVNVLKVQHHGSEHNISEEFCRRVTADHYVFCGNGAHKNPDLAVVELVVTARLARKGKFKLWFNSHDSVTAPNNEAHMKKIQALVAKLTKQNPGRFKSAFLRASAFPPLKV